MSDNFEIPMLKATILSMKDRALSARYRLVVEYKENKSNHVFEAIMMLTEIIGDKVPEEINKG